MTTDTNTTTTATTTIRKIARIHDKATNTYLEVIGFPVSGIQSSHLELLPSEVSEPSVFEKKLLDAGAILMKDKATRKQQHEAVAQTDPPEEWIYEDHTGWTDDRNAFVMPNGVIGDIPTKIIGVNQSKAIKDRSGKLGFKGGWKPWRDTVGEASRNSTTLMFAVGAALGAPLLAFTGEQPFSLNLFGPTRAGKSMATLVAGSIIGIERIGDLISWKITNARLEERLPEFNDSVFPVDDLEKINGSEKVKYERERELAYSISQGSATARYSGHTRAHGGAHRNWSSIVLTSCERSVQELAKAAKMERQHGEAVRLIDVPAVFEGLDHVFDLMPPDVGNVEQWKRGMFAAIAEGIEQNHGKPFRKYIKALIARRATLKEEVANIVNTFVKVACDKFDGAVAHDVARKFAIIYAGGLFGIKCGLLPWKEAELRDAILKSYVGARQLLPDPGVSLRSGLTTLRMARRQLPKISMPLKNRDKNRNYKQLVGYRFSTAEKLLYRLRYEHYCSIFVSGEQRHLVTNWLIEKNHITLATPKKGTERRPQEQLIWPDGSRPRSIELVFKKKKPSPNAKASGPRKPE
jgi:putative DNA primase/helicase